MMLKTKNGVEIINMTPTSNSYVHCVIKDQCSPTGFSHTVIHIRNIKTVDPEE